MVVRAPAISPRQLAAAVGVSESSVKRWADEGLLTCERTAGGHRRIAVSEALRFVRSQRLSLKDPLSLGLAEVALLDSPERIASSPSDTLYEALSAGRAREARGILTSLYVDGWTCAALCDGPIAAAITRIGERWRHDPDGIFTEHRATDLTVHAINHLRALLPEPCESAPVAAGGAPGGDPYILPSLMAALTLAEQGFAVHNLGPDTPVEALLRAALREGASLVWLAACRADISADNLRAARRLADELAPRGVRIVLGGRGLPRSPLSAAPGVLHAESMGELAAFARAMTLDPVAPRIAPRAGGPPVPAAT